MPYYKHRRREKERKEEGGKEGGKKGRKEVRKGKGRKEDKKWMGKGGVFFSVLSFLELIDLICTKLTQYVTVQYSQDT